MTEYPEGGWFEYEPKDATTSTLTSSAGNTYVTHEAFVRYVFRPQKISAATPHPKGMLE